MDVEHHNLFRGSPLSLRRWQVAARKVSCVSSIRLSSIRVSPSPINSRRATNPAAEEERQDRCKTKTAVQSVQFSTARNVQFSTGVDTWNIRTQITLAAYRPA